MIRKGDIVRTPNGHLGKVTFKCRDKLDIIYVDYIGEMAGQWDMFDVDCVARVSVDEYVDRERMKDERICQLENFIKRHTPNPNGIPSSNYGKRDALLRISVEKNDMKRKVKDAPRQDNVTKERVRDAIEAIKSR